MILHFNQIVSLGKLLWCKKNTFYWKADVIRKQLAVIHVQSLVYYILYSASFTYRAMHDSKMLPGLEEELSHLYVIFKQQVEHTWLNNRNRLRRILLPENK